MLDAMSSNPWTYPPEGKGKVYPRTGHEGPRGEYWYSCTPSLTSALDSGWVVNATPVKETWYPLYRRLGGPQGRSGWVRKISPPTGIRSPDGPARSESLYRLHYPGPSYASESNENYRFELLDQ